MSVIEARLETLGVTLPTPPMPVASYVPYAISGNLVFLSGQIPIADGALKYVGKLGVDIRWRRARRRRSFAPSICWRS